MEHKRKQFTFYSSFYDAIRELPKKQQGEVVMAICAYAMDGEEVELKGAAKCCFTLIKPVMDAACVKSETAKKNRAAAIRKKAEHAKDFDQPVTKPQPECDEALNEKENKREGELESELESESELKSELKLESEFDNDCYTRAGEVVDLYRQFCPGLIPCELVSAQTNRAISERLREHGDLDIFRRLFRKAGSSDFLLGKITGWRASLDWLMEERNFAKVLNGAYDNRPDPRAVPKGASGELGAAELEAIARVLREEP